MQYGRRSKAGQTPSRSSHEGKTMVDNEILIMAAFLGPSIPGCEVEKIAAGQTRRG